MHCRAVFHSTEVPNVNITVSFHQYFVIWDVLDVTALMITIVIAIIIMLGAAAEVAASHRVRNMQT